jgi:ribosomal-protein-alanine N-acetyltransferase
VFAALSAADFMTRAGHPSSDGSAEMADRSALACENGGVQTDRLTLEPLVPAHARELFADLKDPALYRFIPRQPPSSSDAVEERFTRLATRRSPDGTEAWLNWVARLRDTGEAVGMFEATVRASESLLAYSLFSRHQRRGYAREACARVIETLRVEHRARVVVAEIDARNAASIRLVEALGFTRTAATDEEVRYELRCST